MARKYVAVDWHDEREEKPSFRSALHDCSGRLTEFTKNKLKTCSAIEAVDVYISYRTLDTDHYNCKVGLSACVHFASPNASSIDEIRFEVGKPISKDDFFNFNYFNMYDAVGKPAKKRIRKEINRYTKMRSGEKVLHIKDKGMLGYLCRSFINERN